MHFIILLISVCLYKFINFSSKKINFENSRLEVEIKQVYNRRKYLIIFPIAFNLSINQFLY